MKPKLDCPLCGVFMKQAGKIFLYPICCSVFNPSVRPDKEKYIRERLKEKSGSRDIWSHPRLSGSGLTF